MHTLQLVDAHVCNACELIASVSLPVQVHAQVHVQEQVHVLNHISLYNSRCQFVEQLLRIHPLKLCFDLYVQQGQVSTFGGN